MDIRPRDVEVGEEYIEGCFVGGGYDHMHEYVVETFEVFVYNRAGGWGRWEVMQVAECPTRQLRLKRESLAI